MQQKVSNYLQQQKFDSFDKLGNYRSSDDTQALLENMLKEEDIAMNSAEFKEYLGNLSEGKFWVHVYGSIFFH